MTTAREARIAFYNTVLREAWRKRHLNPEYRNTIHWAIQRLRKAKNLDF